MNERKTQNQDKFIARLPPGMRERLKAFSEKNHRSMNAELIAALEHWLILTEDQDEMLNMHEPPPTYGHLKSRTDIEARINDILREQSRKLKQSLLSVFAEDKNGDGVPEAPKRTDERKG